MSAAGESTADLQSPEQLHRAFENAFNRRDLDALVALYEPGAVLVTRAGPVRGRDAIRELYRGVLASDVTIELRTLAVTCAGDLAMLHGVWVERGATPEGVPIRRQGWNTETARLQPDGRWLFVLDNPSVPRE